MVSRLFSTAGGLAGSLISQVGEVLAPPVHSNLEDLRDHWKAIKKFYIDENENDIEAFQSSQLPEHLVAMVSILVEEEASLGDTGPCVEFFLQNKILETLCLLAERDSPQGVRKLVLQTVSILLGDVSLPLLPHMSVHRPVRNLIRRIILNPQHVNSTPSSEPKVPPDSEFVALLETLANKLMKDPSLIGFFTDEIHFKEGDLLVFQGLLKHLWDSGTVGDRARRGAANCLLLPQVPRYTQSTTDQPTNSPSPNPSNTETATDSTTPNPASSSSTDSSPSKVKHVSVNWETFIKNQVLDLVSTFRKLPVLATMPSSFPPQSHQLLENCKTRITFYSSLAKLPNNEISKFMISLFEEHFLDGTLGPALLHPNETDAISATIYLRELIPSAVSPLLDIILKFLLGDFVGPERKEEEEVHLLRYTLISRINSKNEQMSMASCKFFSSLISLHNPQVLQNLVLRTIQPSSASSPSVFKRGTSPIPNRALKREDTGLEPLQPSITRFLTLFGSKFAQIAPQGSRGSNNSPIPFSPPSPLSLSSPTGQPEESGSDLLPSTDLDSNNSNSTSNSNSNSSSNFNSISNPNTTTSPIMTTSPRITPLNSSSGINNSGTSEIVGGGAGYDSYLVDAQHQVTIYKAACKEWSQNTLVPTQPLPYVGLFMEQILTKLGKSLDQDLDMNLVVTGLFAKLCYYPILAFTLYLMSHQPNVAPNVPTLYGTIEKLLQDIETRAKSFVNITACIERARVEMAEPTPNYDHSFNKVPNAELEFNPKRFLQAVIVLEEFCKELAAILQAKVVFGIVVEKKGPLRNIQ